MMQIESDVPGAGDGADELSLVQHIAVKFPSAFLPSTVTNH